MFWPLCAALSRPVLSCHIVGVLSRSVLSARARQQSVAQVSKATQCHTLGEQCLRGLLAVQVVCFLCLALVDGLQQAAVCTCCFLAAADCAEQQHCALGGLVYPLCTAARVSSEVVRFRGRQAQRSSGSEVAGFVLSVLVCAAFESVCSS